jgi:trimeric autotransporter adhesin
VRRALLSLLLACAPLGAQVAPELGGELRDRERVDPRLWIVPSAVPLAEASAAQAWTDFRISTGGRWAAFVDPRTGLIQYAEGSGVPWMKGSPRDSLNQLPLLETKARDLLGTLGPALGVRAEELAINRARSGAAADHLWIVDFDVMREGLPVEGARVVLRVNNGNLIQFGTEALPAPDTPTPAFVLTREQAEEALASYVGGLRDDDIPLDLGSRHLLPTQDSGLIAVWEFVFRRGTDPATWRARVDAGNGEVVELVDLNRYARATGGVSLEGVLPMPWVDLSTGGYSNSAGVYPYSSGPLSSQLKGRFVSVNDQCGPVSLSAGAKGNLDFGTSGGTDCVTPAGGIGGAGNTNSARTTYYHVNRAKEAARGWLPGSSWLQAQLQVNTNIPATCNAYWNGASLTFYRSGDGCGNTGEIADVAIHELGHGLDSNDGLATVSGELGTGETYGDLMAALTSHDSCMGEGFRSTPCGGYGDPCTECTGVRDIDWAKHASGKPHTVANFVQTNCSAPGGFGFYVGPCGAHALANNQPEKAREGHCESYVSSEALWDLAARDLPAPGTPAAWAVFERLWYRSRSTAGRAFVCDTSTPVWTSHGCTVDSYWRALRAVDDDDGNLANGTPHSCQLFAAFNRHGIACPSDLGANVCHSACTPPAVPSLTLTPDHQLVDVAWTSSGPGIVYDLYRSETGCEKGFVKIAAGLTATSYRDTEVANLLDYSYRVIARPAGNEACSSSPSSCATTQPFPCITPGPPATLAGSTPQDHQIALSWSNGSPAGDKFNVYRARGSCSSGVFSPLALGTTATSYLDAGLPGTVTYAYRVTSADATGECESVPRCVEVAPKGPCNAPPEFAGLADVNNPGSLQCTLELAWAPGTPLCGGPVTYDVHRGSTPDFVPTSENRIAEGVPGPSYADSGALASGETRFYAVRARDLGNGLRDGNLVRAGAAPTGPTLLSNLTETFDSPNGFDLPGWTHTRTIPPPADPAPGPGWTLVPQPGGGNAWFADEHAGSPSGKVLVSPAFGIGPKTALSFWHRFALQSEPWYCRDGGTLEISTNNGATWQVMPVSAFLSGKFTKEVVNGVRNPLSDKLAWCGSPMGAMSKVEIDLGGSFAGAAGAAQARLRWYEGDDSDTAAAEPNGWYVDSVTIADTQRTEACTPAAAGLDFYPLPLCRALDTRNAPAALAGSQKREVAVPALCGVPPGARAIAVNVTVVGAQSFGSLKLFPANLRHPPPTSFLSFAPGKTRANNGILMLSSDGTGRFTALNGSPGSLHVIVDVSGYFQ